MFIICHSLAPDDKLIAVLLLVGVTGGVSTVVQRVNNSYKKLKASEEKLKASEEELASLEKLSENIMNERPKANDEKLASTGKLNEITMNEKRRDSYEKLKASEEKLKASEEKLALLEKLIDNSSVDAVALENFMKDNYPDQYKDMMRKKKIQNYSLTLLGGLRVLLY